MYQSCPGTSAISHLRGLAGLVRETYEHKLIRGRIVRLSDGRDSGENGSRSTQTDLHVARAERDPREAVPDAREDPAMVRLSGPVLCRRVRNEDHGRTLRMREALAEEGRLDAVGREDGEDEVLGLGEQKEWGERVKGGR